LCSCLKSHAGAELFAHVHSYLSTTRKNDVGTLDTLMCPRAGLRCPTLRVVSGTFASGSCPTGLAWNGSLERLRGSQLRRVQDVRLRSRRFLSTG